MCDTPNRLDQEYVPYQGGLTIEEFIESIFWTNYLLCIA
jgi:hypothetical protein